MGHSEEFWQNAVHWRRNSNQLQCSFLENPRGSVLVLSLFICWVVSTSLQPNELWYTSLPYPSLSPGVCSNSSLLSQWCYPNISSSVVPFSSCPQPFQLSESFLISQFFTLGGQSIGTSALPSVLPMNIQGWFPLILTGLIYLLSEGHSRVFSSTTVQRLQFFGAQPSLWSNSHIHIRLLEKS